MRQCRSPAAFVDRRGHRFTPPFARLFREARDVEERASALELFEPTPRVHHLEFDRVDDARSGERVELDATNLARVHLGQSTLEQVLVTEPWPDRPMFRAAESEPRGMRLARSLGPQGARRMSACAIAAGDVSAAHRAGREWTAALRPRGWPRYVPVVARRFERVR